MVMAQLYHSDSCSLCVSMYVHSFPARTVSLMVPGKCRNSASSSQILQHNSMGANRLNPAWCNLAKKASGNCFFFQGRDLGDPGVVGSGKEVTAPKKK